MSDLMTRPDNEIVPAHVAVRLTGQSRRMLRYHEQNGKLTPYRQGASRETGFAVGDLKRLLKWEARR